MRADGRHLLAIALIAALGTPGGAEAAVGSHAAAVLEQLNAARRVHGARPLRFDARLARAATRHSRDMVLHRYFAHDSRSGTRFSTRIARTGWMRGRRHWRVGENLAWGSGRAADPRAIVSAWLQSPPHRRILLQPRFRVVGIGIAAGTPVGGERAGRTYTADFGS
jgi:uncharacterized protein YkwD